MHFRIKDQCGKVVIDSATGMNEGKSFEGFRDGNDLVQSAQMAAKQHNLSNIEYYPSVIQGPRSAQEIYNQMKKEGRI